MTRPTMLALCAVASLLGTSVLEVSAGQADLGMLTIAMGGISICLLWGLVSVTITSDHRQATQEAERARRFARRIQAWGSGAHFSRGEPKSSDADDVGATNFLSLLGAVVALSLIIGASGGFAFSSEFVVAAFIFAAGMLGVVAGILLRVLS